MKMLEYVGSVIRDMISEARAVNEAYAKAYRNCFEGTREEVERRLAAWDYVHDITRPHRSY